MGLSPAGPQEERSRLVVVGGGPVGLTLALDLGRRGHELILLNKIDFIPGGSRAICFSKRTLDIWERLGVGKCMLDAGVVWDTGKVFWGDSPEPIYEFDLLPLKDQSNPAFINLPQYRAEEILVEALQALPNVSLRWGHELVGMEASENGVRADVDTPTGSYTLNADWLIACDGARSGIRSRLGLDFEGRAFPDSFLIADIRVHEERPSERWFWFDPPFNRGRSALLHKQPDNVWRLDLQLGPDIDHDAARQTRNVEQLVRGMLGDGVAFEKEWYSVYQFECRRISRFVHGRVIFAGDSAHLVSPFGARGCNGGIADADNLAWKLDLVIRGIATGELIESYNEEATAAADDNIKNSSRATEFMTASSFAARAFRDATLELASEFPFARPFVNSGRLSVAPHFPDSSLNTADRDEWHGGVAPGSPALDTPLDHGFLLQKLSGEFALLVNGEAPQSSVDLTTIDTREVDAQGRLSIRYDLQPGNAYLLRPDQYVAARWRQPAAEDIRRAFERASGSPWAS